MGALGMHAARRAYGRRALARKSGELRTDVVREKWRATPKVARTPLIEQAGKDMGNEGNEERARIHAGKTKPAWATMSA
jgi:hypothetical protein